MRYVDAGVDIAAADEALAKVKETVRSTFGPHVVTDLGNFAGLSTLPGGRPDQLLVTSMDGVGTKIKIAIEMGIFNTVGQDLVNHCVGDIGVHGAEPLLFLDYVGMGKLDQSVVTGVIEGLATACRANGCALIGGETAEMPGVYSPPDFDLVGTIIGTVDRSVYVDGSSIEEGDLLFGIPSTGLHTNGFSLVRRVFEQAQIRYRDQAPFSARTLGEELLEVHRSYLAELRALRPFMRGAAHITGGGIPGNLKRILPKGLGAQVDLNSWSVPPLFRFLKEAGEIPEDDLYLAFNMGIGLIVVVPEAKLAEAESLCQDGISLGRILKGEGVDLKGTPQWS